LTSGSSKEADEVYRFAKSKLPAALETKFAEFPAALIDTHGQDLQVVGSNEPSRSASPAIPAPSAGTSTTPALPQKKKAESKPVNVKKVAVEASFQASADDLFGMLTDEKKIPMWSRAAAQVK
jgi:activator of HSP90 ATPase